MGLTVLDAGVLIGFLDSDDHHHQAARTTPSEMIEQRQQIALPASAFSEALVGPARRDEDAVSLAREAVERLPIEIAPLDEKVAIEAARLRATHRSLRLPDALVI